MGDTATVSEYGNPIPDARTRAGTSSALSAAATEV